LSSFVIHTLTILAQTSGGGGSGAPAAPQHQPGFGDLLTSPLFPITIVFVIVWFFMINSKRKGDKQRQAMLKEMKRGDRIQTIGGILGTVVEVRDGEVLVKVDESNNTKIKFSRSAIHRVVTEEDKAENNK
jgi:preprotein translocase subunit YajC